MPRLRLVAGPNGSGKTTLIRNLVDRKIPLGQYINPDDIAKHICLSANLEKTNTAFQEPLNLPKFLNDFETYFASLVAQSVAQGLRKDYLDYGLSLTYESVMSHKSHLDFVDTAKTLGFSPYLYYICTSEPELNVARVRKRVLSGGHDVSEGKILSRYKNSLGHLKAMASKCHRTFFFDNSGIEHVHIAEITPDGYLDIFEKQFEKTSPAWFVENVLIKWEKSKVRAATL